ncbi:MAG TPA: hypothetical protein PKD59_07780 [Miltoncostaeaceae bacterium]|nr:hypothetical protein [Miltoncostaeaceae bacterium]
MRRRALIAATAVAAGLAVAGCGSGVSGSAPASAPNPNVAEVNPAGDIPDNQAFVAYAPPGGGYSIKVPEGWARVAAGRAVTFTDKLNSIRLETHRAATPLTVRTGTRTVLPMLGRTVPGFVAGDVTSVTRSGGKGVLVTYLARSAPDPVTGKTGVDAVERYAFHHAGREVVVTLSGPNGADNVDPWMTVTDSLRWTP